jgi:hypothetical protein
MQPKRRASGEEMLDGGYGSTSRMNGRGPLRGRRAQVANARGWPLRSDAEP